jgi:hypothetical protein
MDINNAIAATMNAAYKMNEALKAAKEGNKNKRESLFKKAMDILDDAYNLAGLAFKNLKGGRLSFIANTLRNNLLELQKKIDVAKNAVMAKVETLNAVKHAAVKHAAENLLTQVDKISIERKKIKAGIKLKKVRKSKKVRKLKKVKKSRNGRYHHKRR